MDYEYQRPDGRVIDLGLSAAQLPLPDGRLGYLYTFQDVTDLRRLERDAQMQKRLAAVGEMAAGIAHEIRNPLAAMSGSMQILRQELPLSSDQARLMDIVLARVGAAERDHPVVSRLRPAAAVRDAAARSAPRRAGHGDRCCATVTEVGESHAIEVDLPAYEVLVDADENQVRQVVWNLATNGLRAMPDGGALRLRAAREPLDGGPAAVLTVTDQGVGIEPRRDRPHLPALSRAPSPRAPGWGWPSFTASSATTTRGWTSSRSRGAARRSA